MGLIDLKTDLKSLKYGSDQRGGGSSNQPYVTTPIPDGFAPSSPDFLLRNGYLNPVSSLNDVSRLTKWFADTKSASGILFTAKQQLLERQNVKIPGGFNRIYNPLGTIAQAGVLSTGYHLNKQGLNPFVTGYFKGGRDGYFYPTRAGSNVDGGINGGENRLALLYTSKIADQDLGTFAINPFGITGPNDQINLLSYSGGPNSVLGFGKTNIRIQNPTRTVVPKDKATISFKSSIVDNVGYLTPTNSVVVNWSYNPSGENNLSNQYIIEVGEENNLIYTDNVSNILNRDTSTIIPIGKSANTFIKSQSTLKSEPGYLVPSGVEPGNIIYQTSLTGSSNIFKVETGKELEYKNNANSIVNNLYNTSSIDRTTYSKNKSFDNVITPNLKSFQTASIAAGFETESNNEILNNISQSLPDVLEIPDDIVEGKQKTTTLSSLNPKYFKLNENNTVSLIEADEFIDVFNREKTYNTSKTTYHRDEVLRGNVNNLNIEYSDGQNIKDIVQGSRENQIEQANSDLIKFFFEINNNSGATSTQNWFLFFRAYLNDLGDSYKADWQSYKYVGRAENFYKYGGFSRDISLGFTIYAHTRAEMAPIYNKLNYLVGVTAPDYSEPGYMRGNFVNLTVGDYLDNVPGIITDISLKPSFDAGWDINRDVLTGTILQQSHLQLPKLIEVSMTFTPIHSFTPQFGEAFIRNTAPLQKPTTNIQ
jgi:hypothetical protein